MLAGHIGGADTMCAKSYLIIDIIKDFFLAVLFKLLKITSEYRNYSWDDVLDSLILGLRFNFSLSNSTLY